MGLTSKTNGFQVVLAGGGQALKLAAESPEVAAEWKLALTTSIENASAMHTVQAGHTTPTTTTQHPLNHL